MSQEEMLLVTIQAEELHELIKKKLVSAGLEASQADEVANHLVYADLSGIHSHGAVRVEYYAERISKGGVTLHPKMHFEQTGESTGIFHGDNGIGQYVVNEALKPTIDMAKKSGLAVVGISKMSHSGTMAYYLEKVAREGLVGISMCQSDPMVVPFGGRENYFGTNPIGFAAPRAGHEPIVFDMATTIQAWGKILDARSRNQDIPPTWAVDKDGLPTTNPHEVQGLLPIAGPKGYGLMMIVDILAGSLLGLPFGKHVTSMYADLTSPRNLGQLFIIIDPSRFTNADEFSEQINRMVEELHSIEPAEGFESVLYPGERNKLVYLKNQENGIPIPKSIIDYLKSNQVHNDQFGGKGAFA